MCSARPAAHRRLKGAMRTEEKVRGERGRCRRERAARARVVGGGGKSDDRNRKQGGSKACLKKFYLSTFFLFKIGVTSLCLICGKNVNFCWEGIFWTVIRVRHGVISVSWATLIESKSERQ